MAQLDNFEFLCCFFLLLSSVDFRALLPLLLLLGFPVPAPVDEDVLAAVLLVRLPPEPHGLVALHGAALSGGLRR